MRHTWTPRTSPWSARAGKRARHTPSGWSRRAPTRLRWRPWCRRAGPPEAHPCRFRPLAARGRSPRSGSSSRSPSCAVRGVLVRGVKQYGETIISWLHHTVPAVTVNSYFLASTTTYSDNWHVGHYPINFVHSEFTNFLISGAIPKSSCRYVTWSTESTNRICARFLSSTSSTRIMAKPRKVVPNTIKPPLVPSAWVVAVDGLNAKEFAAAKRGQYRALGKFRHTHCVFNSSLTMRRPAYEGWLQCYAVDQDPRFGKMSGKSRYCHGETYEFVKCRRRVG